MSMNIGVYKQEFECGHVSVNVSLGKTVSKSIVV